MACLAPLVWLGIQMLWVDVWRELNWDFFRWKLLYRTIFYNGAAAALACILAIPPAIVVGRGRGVLSKIFTLLIPLSLALPSIAYAYGWIQFCRIHDCLPSPDTWGDVARCVGTLAGWLWGIPAILIGLSLRGLDPNVQLAAMLDGRLWRITFRLLRLPILASFAMVMALAMQEFGVYERNGIVILSTEVRTVFETGISSGGDSSAVSMVSGGMGVGRDNQGQRAGKAIAAGFPLLFLAGGLTVLASMMMKRSSAAEALSAGQFPECLRARWLSHLGTLAVLWVTLVIPMRAMAISIDAWRWRTNFAGESPLTQIWGAVGDKMLGSLYYGALAGIAGIVIALAATGKRRGWAMVLSIGAFLIGGELLAIALIRVYNWDIPVLRWIYNNEPIMVIGYVSRFGWIGVLAGFSTFSGPWKSLRETAAVDGADLRGTLQRVVWPLAWPTIAAAGLMMMILSITEVSTTVMVSPQKPQPLMPMLMSWVHYLRNNEMMLASLLLMGVVAVLMAGAIGLLTLGKKMLRRTGWMGVLILMVVFTPGCKDHSKPAAIWMSTGMAQGQLVYPRGIAYSKTDRCYFVIDRSARIQRVELDGTASAMWRMPQQDNGKPVGISVSPDGDVYVPDTHYFRVMVFSSRGEYKREWGKMGKGPGEFIYPTDVAFDSEGNIYVSEYGENDRIQVFDPKTLEVIRVIGKPGQGNGEFARPQSMVIDGDDLYVADACNHRIEVLDLKGNWKRNIGSVGKGLGQFGFPYGLDLDSKGQLVVCEFGNNRIQWVDKNTGKGIRIWGVSGREPGEVAYPWAVAVNEKDQVLIVDSGNNRLQLVE